jgi:hypothetical protein
LGRDLNLVRAEIDSRCRDSGFMEPECKGLVEPSIGGWHLCRRSHAIRTS